MRKLSFPVWKKFSYPFTYVILLCKLLRAVAAFGGVGNFRQGEKSPAHPASFTRPPEK